MKTILYAGFWERAGALIIDVVVMAVPSLIIGDIISASFANQMAIRGADEATSALGGMIWAKLTGIAVGWVYCASMESSHLQGTVGKRVLGLRVVGCDLNRLTFGRATGRFFGRFLSAIPFGLGFLVQPFTARRQTWHDMLADCLVIAGDKNAGTQGSTGQSDKSSAPDVEQNVMSEEPPDQTEESAYEQALAEVESNNPKKGIWGKAFANEPNDDNRRKALYIKLRVRQILRETPIDVFEYDIGKDGYAELDCPQCGNEIESEEGGEHPDFACPECGQRIHLATE